MRQNFSAYSNFLQFVTQIILYTIRMKIYLLSATVSLGFLWLILLFIACFCGVHGIRLAKYGWTYQKSLKSKSSNKAKNAPTGGEPKKEPSPLPPQEPIYYIVEKKRTRQKKYGEPKEIQFKP